MKKLSLLSISIVFAFMAAQAQIKTKVQKARVEAPSKVIEPVTEVPKTSPPPPPPSTNKGSNTGNQDIPVYTLTSARVYIRTGSDNKEFLSDVRVSLWKKGRLGWDYANDCYYITPSLKNEMAVNSNTDLGLDKYPGNSDKFKLTNLQASGLDLIVTYQPNIFLDAWKVENITLVLEFKDQNGNLHPTLGSKIISFSTAVGFLNAEYRVFKCKTDQNFNPLTASIEK
jgi:hypothetical protein